MLPALFQRRACPLLLAAAGALFTAANIYGELKLPYQERSTPDHEPIPAEAQTRLRTLQADLQAARSSGNAKAEAQTLNQIGEEYYRTSNYQKALDEYSHALKAASFANDPIAQAAALSGSANCHFSLGEPRSALLVYRAGR